MESLNNIIKIIKEVMEQGITPDINMHKMLLQTYREIEAEVIKKQRVMHAQRYLVNKVFLGDEINQRLATMCHVMDMLMAMDRAIMIQKRQVAVLVEKKP